MDPQGDGSLAHRLAQRIAQEGPIPFRDWMEACLYDPREGYYCRPGRKTGPGTDADFATSPTLHPFLAQCVAEEIARAWEAADRPEPVVVEHGGGEGDLARDALAHLDARHPQLARRIRWVHVERSPHHRALQQSRDPRIIAGGPGVQDWVFVVAHEFLDALPFHLLEKRDGAWQGVAVDCVQRGFAPVHAPPAPAAVQEAPRAEQVPEGQRVAVMLDAADWFRQTAAAFPCATALVIDYGRPRPWAGSLDGTVRTFRGQQLAGAPWSDPGSQDITATVDTEACARWAAAAGWDVHQEPQETWLLGHGILDTLNAIPRSTREDASRYLRLRQLLLPQAMGRAFFVQRSTRRD